MSTAAPVECTSCGKLSSIAEFCEHCGAPLERSSSSLYAVGYGKVADIDDDIDPVPVAAHIVPAHTEGATEYPNSPLRKAILVVLLIAWLGIVLYQFIPWNSTPTSIYVQSLNAQTFQAEVIQGEPEQTWVVNCWSAKRDGGRSFLPGFNEVANDLHERATFASVQVDKAPRVAEEFAITEYPTILVIRHGIAQFRSDGVKDKDELSDWLKTTLEPVAEPPTQQSVDETKTDTPDQPH